MCFFIDPRKKMLPWKGGVQSATRVPMISHIAILRYFHMNLVIRFEWKTITTSKARYTARVIDVYIYRYMPIVVNLVVNWNAECLDRRMGRCGWYVNIHDGWSSIVTIGEMLSGAICENSGYMMWMFQKCAWKLFACPLVRRDEYPSGRLAWVKIGSGQQTGSS